MEKPYIGSVLEEKTLHSDVDYVIKTDQSRPLRGTLQMKRYTTIILNPFYFEGGVREVLITN